MNNPSLPTFLVFSDDWGEHPSSCQHIFKIIAIKHTVVWVNTVGLRTPKLNIVDFKKAILKIKKMFKGGKSNKKCDTAGLHLSVLQPLMIPFLNVPGVRKFNCFSVIRAVKRHFSHMGIQSPIMVITAPNACDYIGLCGEKRVVYYNVDDFSEWPGLEKDLVQDMETQLVEKSDRFIATSQLLFDRIAEKGNDVLLLTHGVDADFFSEKKGKEHRRLNDVPRPRVGYFGLFDDRSDLDLLRKTALSLPEISFVITGNVEIDIRMLHEIDNIYFTGSVPYSELPSMAQGFDICMLPYKINKLTDAIQPLKIKEYLATGKPVISTGLKEAVKLKDYLDIGVTVDEWVEFIKYNINGISPEMEARRKIFFQKESWGQKSQQFLSYCLEE